jgi:hypothetical protein
MKIEMTVTARGIFFFSSHSATGAIADASVIAMSKQTTMMRSSKISQQMKAPRNR